MLGGEIGDLGDGGEAEVVGVGRVDAAHQRIDEAKVHLGPEAGPHVRAQRVGLDARAPPEGLGGRAHLSGPTDELRPGERHHVGGHAQQQALRDVVKAVPPHCGLARSGGHQLVSETDRVRQCGAPGQTGEECVGSLVDAGMPGER